MILVTGSKGKGSTARLIAAGQTAAGRRTLLFTSPEDMTPLDRIRIDGTVIAAADAIGAYQMLRTSLRAVEASLPAGEALSPFGQFLLLALAHARRSAVDRLVLETGLGAADDEAGRLAAAIGVVTAILPEHLDRLGPDIDDVARAKLDIRHRCRRLILSDQAAAAAGGPASISGMRWCWHSLALALALARSTIRRWRRPACRPGWPMIGRWRRLCWRLMASTRRPWPWRRRWMARRGPCHPGARRHGPAGSWPGRRRCRRRAWTRRGCAFWRRRASAPCCR
ncbi:hypothetical protein ACFQ4K_16260 [Tistrella bauzanensis]